MRRVAPLCGCLRISHCCSTTAMDQTTRVVHIPQLLSVHRCLLSPFLSHRLGHLLLCPRTLAQPQASASPPSPFWLPPPHRQTHCW